MKKVYGINQKYNPKDYVEYIPSISVNGTPIGESKFGYINTIKYYCNQRGAIELEYVIGKYVGCQSGNCVKQSQIIRKVKPKDPNFGYREYLEEQITICQMEMNGSEKEKKRYEKLLRDYDKGEKKK